MTQEKAEEEEQQSRILREQGFPKLCAEQFVKFRKIKYKTTKRYCCGGSFHSFVSAPLSFKKVGKL